MSILSHGFFALLAVAIVPLAIAADASDSRYELARRIDALEQRVLLTRPQRREAPIRTENLSDIEAREIEALTHALYRTAIVNIGTVVTGCPCEEGPTCADQVWVVASLPVSDSELQFSRIGGVWQIGAIQRWWLEANALAKQTPGGFVWASLARFYPRWLELYSRFPECLLPGAPEKKADTDRQHGP